MRLPVNMASSPESTHASTEREVPQSAVVTSSPVESTTQLSPEILQSYKRIAHDHSIYEYDLLAQPIGGPGENAYSSVLKVQLLPKHNRAVQPFYTILKIAPTNEARRAHMRIQDAFSREVFIYTQVFKQYTALADETPEATPFNAVPRILHASLTVGAEYIIFEDLTPAGYVLNSRANLPNCELVVCAFRALAQIHAMSFVLQALRPQLHKKLVEDMHDNLFTTNTAQVTIEFGKKYVRCTRQMLDDDSTAVDAAMFDRPLLVNALRQIEAHYLELCLDAVNGANAAPYAVICHGDFWNNNILYEYKERNARQLATDAKLIDFQISRYAPPVLDLVHYLFACTEKSLRDAHFQTFMHAYYDTLTALLKSYKLDPGVVYPMQVFQQQLRDYGVYGFCMSALSIPFFVSTASELPELDEVCEAVKQKCGNALEVLNDYDLLTPRTLPLFKQRMIGNTLDLHKYQMLDKVLKY